MPNKMEVDEIAELVPETGGLLNRQDFVQSQAPAAIRQPSDLSLDVSSAPWPEALPSNATQRGDVTMTDAMGKSQSWINRWRGRLETEESNRHRPNEEKTMREEIQSLRKDLDEMRDREQQLLREVQDREEGFATLKGSLRQVKSKLAKTRHEMTLQENSLLAEVQSQKEQYDKLKESFTRIRADLAETLNEQYKQNKTSFKACDDTVLHMWMELRNRVNQAAIECSDMTTPWEILSQPSIGEHWRRLAETISPAAEMTSDPGELRPWLVVVIIWYFLKCELFSSGSRIWAGTQGRDLMNLCDNLDGKIFGRTCQDHD